MGGGNRSSLWPWKREEKEDVGSHGGEKSRRMPAAMEEGRRMRKRVVIEKGLGLPYLAFVCHLSDFNDSYKYLSVLNEKNE